MHGNTPTFSTQAEEIGGLSGYIAVNIANESVSPQITRNLQSKCRVG